MEIAKIQFLILTLLIVKCLVDFAWSASGIEQSEISQFTKYSQTNCSTPMPLKVNKSSLYVFSGSDCRSKYGLNFEYNTSLDFKIIKSVQFDLSLILTNTTPLPEGTSMSFAINGQENYTLKSNSKLAYSNIYSEDFVQQFMVGTAYVNDDQLLFTIYPLKPSLKDIYDFQVSVFGITLSVQTCVSYCTQCDESLVCQNCLDGYYLNLDTKTCQQCNQNCVTCDGPNQNNCLSCYSGNFLDQNTKQCKNCDQNCKTCDGPDPNNCLSCGTAKKYQISTRKCVDQCDSNEFTNLQNNCQKCHQSCASCYGSDLNNCNSCGQNSYFYNNMCLKICPNGFQSNPDKNSCDACEKNWITQCNLCNPSCKLCNQDSINLCQNCYTETMELDNNNQCVCKNQKDQRGIFYLCSYQNIAVLQAILSATTSQLTINFGSPLKIITSTPSQSFCQQIFEKPTLDKIGADSLCSIKGNEILVDLGDSSIIMENDEINMMPNILQFQDYSNISIDTFYRNFVFQIPPDKPLLDFEYNQIENSCNPLNITLLKVQNDGGRRFISLSWTLIEIQGVIRDEQKNNIIQVLNKASQNMETALIIDPQLIPPNLNIIIQFSSRLKVNTTYSEIFTITYEKQKFIRISYLQYPYPPNYK